MTESFSQLPTIETDAVGPLAGTGRAGQAAMYCPPLAEITAPVTKPACSDAR